MDADLDPLLTTVLVTADDLLPDRAKNAARRVTDAEVVTLCVAQAIMGIPSDRRFLAVAGKRLAHLFPALPQQSGYFKRRRRLADTLEWLMGMFASHGPGFEDDLLLIDSTPVECARSRRNGQTRRILVSDRRDRRRRGLWLLRQPLTVLLGDAPARDLRPRWETPGSGAVLPQARRARGRLGVVGPLPPSRASDPDRRQGLRRARVRHGSQPTRRDIPAPPLAGPRFSVHHE